MTEFVRSFEPTYKVAEDPSPFGRTVSFSFAGDDLPQLAPAVELEVTRPDGHAWHGDFYGLVDGLSAVVDGPGPDVLTVVAAGVGFVVPVSSPGDYTILGVRPVRAIECAPERGLVILAGYSDLVALGADGMVRWEARRLSSDGFAEVRLTSSAVVVRGYDAAEGHEVETTLDLATGEIVSRR